jgi:hypothetical protein
MLTALASPHLCHQCRRPLRDPATGTPFKLGRRRSTVRCPDCGWLTSVYAVLHRCQGCSTLLESPLSRARLNYTCSQCGTVATTPDDLLLDVKDPALDDRRHFLVTCPDCNRRWAAGHQDVGQRTVCPGCHSSWPIPRHGEHLPRTATGHAEVTRVCDRCQQHVPVHARACPLCGLEDDT